MTPNRAIAALETARLNGNDPADLAKAAALLRSGRLVAIPTETVYGLAANALDAAAVEGIFVAKERPHWDPLIVHIGNAAMLRELVIDIPVEAQQLMDAFWPGPLTLLLPRSSRVPDAVTAGRPLVGVRMPNHPVALALLQAGNLPLAAPSANRFGHISPTTAQHVLDDLDGRIDAVLNAGPCAIGVESTVFDPGAKVLYRQGGISQRQIEDVLGTAIMVYEGAVVHHAAPESLPSPGVGIRHYAPCARVVLVGSEEELHTRLAEFQAHETAVLLPTDWYIQRSSVRTIPWASWSDTPALARGLYDSLRTLDELNVATILAPLPAPSADPLVEAIRDRLMKAAREA